MTSINGRDLPSLHLTALLQKIDSNLVLRKAGLPWRGRTATKEEYCSEDTKKISEERGLLQDITVSGDLAPIGAICL